MKRGWCPLVMVLMNDVLTRIIEKRVGALCEAGSVPLAMI